MSSAKLTAENFDKLLGPGVRQLLLNQVEADLKKALAESLEKRLAEFAESLAGKIESFTDYRDNTIRVLVNFNDKQVSEHETP